MDKSIHKIWNEAFINETSLIAPKINNLYNQKSKSIIHKIKRTYEIDNKGLIPMALLVALGGFIVSEAIIGLYGSFLILCLYFFNSNLLKRFTKIDVKSDNLTYLKSYRNIITEVTKATKKLFVFAIPLAVLSIFILAYAIKETSFLSKFIASDSSTIEIIGVGIAIAFTVSLIGIIVYYLSTKIVYGTHISKLDDIIREMEALKK